MCKGLWAFFSSLCVSDADWLGKQTPLTATVSAITVQSFSLFHPLSFSRSPFHPQTSAGRTKLHTLVDFPVSELDLTPHLEPRRKTSPENHSNAGWETWGRSRANSTSNPEENMYDLYAVCNHLGGMSGGHYTAYCKNSIDGQWYLFDDTNVEKTTYREVVTKGAYLLFYTRRNVGSSSASESSMGSDHWAWRMPRFSYESIASSEELEEPGRDKSGEGFLLFLLFVFTCLRLS